ncbi:zinc finger protein 569-like isoform X1 [Ostrinia nubilalis]|uniref:zinc finger protein 569-like isoform X1 n=1 Tax=Ostrinia nubilalis TaxID=29057 RepID=UPI0030824E91
MSGESWKLEQDLCRCCHSEGAHKNLSEACIDGEDEILSDMLHDTLDITINPVTGPLGLVTYTICEPCMMRLQDAWSFKQQVVDCERRFHELYSRNALKMDPDNVIVVDVKQEVDLPIVVKTSPNEGVKEERLHSDDEDFLPVDDVQSDLSDQEQTKKKRKPRGRPKAPPKIKRTPRHAQNKTQKVDDSTADDGKEKKGTALVDEYVMIRDDKYTCKACELSYIRPSDLRYHVIRSHLKQKFIRCPHCPERFMYHSQRKMHISSKHSKEDPKKFSCAHCSREFKRKNTLAEHMMDVHIEKKCQHCEKQFVRKRYLFHLNEKHGVSMPTCGVCGLRTLTQSSLVRHQRNVHLNEKNKKCEVCGKKFHTQSNLQDHMITHDQKKVFKCDVCEKSFARKECLKTHSRIHTGEKPFICNLCFASFVQRASLRFHMRSHHASSSSTKNKN